LKFKADFPSKMSVCRHELGVQPPPPRQFQPWILQRVFDFWQIMLPVCRHLSCSVSAMAAPAI